MYISPFFKVTIYLTPCWTLTPIRAKAGNQKEETWKR